MTEADQVAFTAAFDRFFKGNAAAVRMCADFVQVAHVWDDLVDADKPVSSETADMAFRKMILEIPANEFYRTNFSFLQPVIVMVWAQWTAANVLEDNWRVGDRDKAYMLRASLYQLFHACAVLCGGLDWAKEIGPEIYRLYGERLENF
jgi:DNA-binding FadR family transcriptional regulator